MENLLKTLLKEKKEAELIRLNAVDIVNSILDELQDRERDVISRRFALGRDNYQTLEEIGRTYNLTRERVRQIERASLKKIKSINDLDKRLESVREVVSKLLDEHGGIMEKNFMLDILTVMTVKIEQDGGSLDRESYKNYLEFLLSELLDDHIQKVNKSNKFSPFFKLKNQTVDYFDNIVDELKSKLDGAKKVLEFEELVNVLKNLKSFSLHSDKIVKDKSDLDLKAIFKDDVFPEWADIINKNKPFYSFMQAVKDVNPNKFGFWGHDDWSEIKPKRIADKIFLVLKNEKKPLHFTDITTKINEVGFDKKKVSSGSVHNELILDDRYVLTDRGVYGLKDWSMAS